MNWFKKLFYKHKHIPIWESREAIERITIDFTTGGVIDIEPGTRYLRKGRCIECGQHLTNIYKIADIFDREQPYDKKEK